MGLIFVVFVAAYALTGLVMDGAAAVRGKPIPSTLRREARQKAREHRQTHPGYLGTIWGNALESWADASTRRHQRRRALREAAEAKKGPEWVERKLAKLDKAAERRERFAEKAGVLWGKARDAAANVRERRREDEAWAANARFDAERDDTVPAGLQGSTDLDENQGEATVLPFRSRDEDDTEDEKAVERTHSWVCRWGAWEGDSPCTDLRGPGSEYCPAHTPQHNNRCTWGEKQRCRKPRFGGSVYCPEHHTADPKIQAAIESTVGFERHQRDDLAADEAAEAGEAAGSEQDTEPADASTTDQPATGGQDNNTATEKENTSMSTPVNAPAEITSLTDAIAYTQSMGASLTSIMTQVEQWQSEMDALARQATKAKVDTETAVAYLRGAGIEGNNLTVVESALEQLDAINAKFSEAAQGMTAAVEAAQAGATAYRTAHAGFTSQTGIQEHMQAAQASGNRAGKREFYEAG